MSGIHRDSPLQIEATTYDLGDASATVRTTPRRWRWVTEGQVDLPEPTAAAKRALVEVLRAAGGAGDGLESAAEHVWRRLADLAEHHGPRTPAIEVLGVRDPLLLAVTECDRLLSVAARSVVHGLDVRGGGRVERVAVSGGGTPKASVDSAQVAGRGLLGDQQADRAHHGRPFQAVCLYSLDRFSSLAAEGHPVVPGALGENLLIDGLDWSLLRPGVRLGIGDEVLLELNAYAPPCSTIAEFFTDRRFDRVDHDKEPGWARFYAWVVRGGTVRASDEVVVVP